MRRGSEPTLHTLNDNITAPAICEVKNVSKVYIWGIRMYCHVLIAKTNISIFENRIER